MFPRVRLRFRQFVLRSSVLCTSTHDLIGRWFDYIWFFVVSKDRLRLWLRLKAGAKIGQHHQRHLTTLDQTFIDYLVRSESFIHIPHCLVIMTENRKFGL